MSEVFYSCKNNNNNKLSIPSEYHKFQLCLFWVTFKSYSASCGDKQQKYRVSLEELERCPLILQFRREIESLP